MHRLAEAMPSRGDREPRGYLPPYGHEHEQEPPIRDERGYYDDRDVSPCSERPSPRPSPRRRRDDYGQRRPHPTTSTLREAIGPRTETRREPIRRSRSRRAPRQPTSSTRSSGPYGDYRPPSPRDPPRASRPSRVRGTVAGDIGGRRRDEGPALRNDHEELFGGYREHRERR